MHLGWDGSYEGTNMCADSCCTSSTATLDLVMLVVCPRTENEGANTASIKMHQGTAAIFVGQPACMAGVKSQDSRAQGKPAREAETTVEHMYIELTTYFIHT
jgi:hypothetical protein